VYNHAWYVSLSTLVTQGVGKASLSSFIIHSRLIIRFWILTKCALVSAIRLSVTAWLQMRWYLIRGAYTSGNHLDCCLKLLKMAIKWVSASGDPAAEPWSCMRYFSSVRLTVTNDNVDSNLPFCQVRPWSKRWRRKSIGSKWNHRCDWSLYPCHLKK